MATNAIWVALLLSIGSQESRQNPDAINKKEKAYGIYQIRQLALDDINKRYGTSHVLEDFLGEAGIPLSQWAFFSYGRMWGAKTPEDYAKIWNGGPSALRAKGVKKQRLTRYWLKVSSRMRV